MNLKLVGAFGAVVLVGTLALSGTMRAGEALEPVLAVQPTAAPAPVEPDTTGAAMWAHIQEEDYEDSWPLWPGLGEFYTGNDPHGMLLTTYVNGIAMRALQDGRDVLPAGSVVIKNNYMPNRELAAVTVMYKRSGYNSQHNDWFFTKHLPDGSLDRMPNGMAMEGRLPGCQSCHERRADRDYLYAPRP